MPSPFECGSALGGAISQVPDECYCKCLESLVMVMPKHPSDEPGEVLLPNIYKHFCLSAG